MEKYPSLVEGTGLENREVGNGAGVRIPLSPPYKYLLRDYNIAEWSSLVARWAHNPKVVSSNLASATKMVPWCSGYHVCLSRRRSRVQFSSGPPFFLFGSVAQSVEQGTENPCVGGSIPTEATILLIEEACYAPLAQLDRALDYGSKG